MGENTMEKIILDGNSLTLDQIYEVVYDGACVEISEEALKRAEKAKHRPPGKSF